MATIKSYSDLQQSKKLAEILPLESADMAYYQWKGDGHLMSPNPFVLDGMEEKENGVFEYVPCWSLASLLEELPYELCDDDGNSSYLQINKEDDVYQLVYTDPHGEFESIETDRYEYFVDACYEMIIRLHELNLL